IAIDTWEGFIFINVDPKPTITLSDYLRPMYAQLEGYPFDKLTACYSWSTEVNCNWKMALDAFQETYHVPFVHGPSIARSFIRPGKGNMIVPVGLLCGDYHRWLSIAGNPQSVYGNPKALTEEEASTAVKASKRPIGEAALRLGRNGTKVSF